MDIQSYINQKKKVSNALLKYLDTSDIENDQQIIFNIFESQQIQGNRDELIKLFQLISKVSKNHHRNLNFFNKIQKILNYFIVEIKQTFTNNEIFDIFKNSKSILLFLLENQVITMNESILQHLKHKKFELFFYPEIKKFNPTENLQLDEETLNNFDQKRKNGENDSYICELIRNDSVEEFVTFVNQTNLPLSKTTIKPSIFETNSLLIKNEQTTLIEYAAFFGSIQIFQYLRINDAELKPSLWLYSIHSKNADIIHIIEEDKITPPNYSYLKCIEESIKCHHNEITNYILNNLMTDKTEIFDVEKNFEENLFSYCFRYQNFEFIPNFQNEFIIFYLCKYNYTKLVELLLQNKIIELNKTVIKHFILINKISNV